MIRSPPPSQTTHQHKDRRDLLAEAEVHPEGLREEQHADRQIQRDPVEVERVASRYHQTRCGTGISGIHEVVHDSRKHHLGGCRAQREEQLVLDIHHEPPQAHPARNQAIAARTRMSNTEPR